MYSDTEDTNKEFEPKKYCTCIDNNGKPKQLLYRDWGSKHEHDEEYCAYCGHVSWQEYIKRQVGNKKGRNKRH